ncbi:hypothetical protein M409DRAFT_64175 [Zasmidium cellare ATCC 36951]|uniref:Peptidase S53 domain-containing protein n=1 Tax=Zasmidium cellare ATCC 36951 TaxID=1080233 RepID=A0A6A6CW48_ZASCE|nr:uncharacterized protein M409DRAFT_64175 [Zasmidium cellare ATCC 36951]KAF2170428.1 hypothetical protein M409DRAFT_64175 [Zasmidium cellare ATCC 36951]
MSARCTDSDECWQSLACTSLTQAFPMLFVPLDAISFVVHEKRSTSDSGWTRSRRVEPSVLLAVRIGLVQSNLHLGEELVQQIADPSSPRFGKHLAKREVDELFAPAPDTITSVKTWLMKSGIHDARIGLTQSNGWIAFDARADEIEDLLDTEYFWYEHIPSGDLTVGCENYSIPEGLQTHIDYIKPGINLHAPEKPNDTTTCDKAITPACIRALYKIPINRLKDPSNALGIFENGDFYAQEDLDRFFAEFEPRVVNGTHPELASIDGGKAPKPPAQADGESDLDFELALPLIYPQKVVLYQTNDDQYTVSGAGGLFNTFLDAIDGSYCGYSAFGQTGDDPNFDDEYPDKTNPGGFQGQRQCGVFKPTNVISISYSKQEADLPYYYQQRQCNEFMKLALQGHTILVASGDYGVSGRSYDPEPNGCLGHSHTVFNPGFPSCPYVTTVGATQVAPGKTYHDPEVAAYDPSHDGTSSAFSSGGGFSNIFSIPDYQRSALQRYFADHDPGYSHYSALHDATHNTTTVIGANGGLYNRFGRGMPDASTPIVASIINNINEQRLATNKAPIGFLNHIIYANPGVFNDITAGSNPGCGVDGFHAVSGWDPVTGLGTPDYPKLSNLLLNLP